MNNRGISLLEVIISITLFSFVSLSIYTMTDNAQNSKDSVLSEDRHLLQAQLALARIELDFSQVYSPFYFSSRAKNPSSFVPTEHFPRTSSSEDLAPGLFSPEKNILIFMTSANRRKIQDAKQSRWAWIRYSLEKMPEPEDEAEEEQTEEESYRLMRQIVANDPFAQDKNWEEIRGQSLLKNVTSVLFEFWDSQKKTWTDRIELLPRPDQLAIRAMRITLEFIDPDAKVRYKRIRIFRPLWPYFDTKKDAANRRSNRLPSQERSQ